MLPEQWTALRDLGVAGLLAFALVGGFRRWYVWGWTYEQVSKERDFWRDLALRSVKTTETAVDKLPEKRDA